MTCSSCRALAATSERQWQKRQRNLELLSDVWRCPHCRSSDWATTRDEIVVGTSLPLQLLIVGFGVAVAIVALIYVLT